MRILYSHSKCGRYDIARWYPDKILAKPGKLDLGEQEIMKLHTVIGAKISKWIGRRIYQTRWLYPCYHEKWDGTGIQMLNGRAIHLRPHRGIADVFDAWHRDPYKEPLPRKIISYIKSWRGSYFDPEVVDTFIAILEKYSLLKRNIEG